MNKSLLSAATRFLWPIMDSLASTFIDQWSDEDLLTSDTAAEVREKAGLLINKMGQIADKPYYSKPTVTAERIAEIRIADAITDGDFRLFTDAECHREELLIALDAQREQNEKLLAALGQLAALPDVRLDEVPHIIQQTAKELGVKL